MSLIDASRVRKILSSTVGPVPWYWETFPSVHSQSGQKFIWRGLTFEVMDMDGRRVDKVLVIPDRNEAASD